MINFCELDSQGNIVVKYIYGRTLLAMRRQDGLYFYHLDMVGSVIAVTDGNGTVYNRYRYTAFGSLREKEEGVPNRFYFNGKPMDETGLYYYGFRYYAPGLGRFVRPDPLLYMGGNAYGYPFQNPVIFVDILGLDLEPYAYDPGSNTWYFRGVTVYGTSGIDDYRGGAYGYGSGYSGFLAEQLLYVDTRAMLEAKKGLEFPREFKFEDKARLISLTREQAQGLAAARTVGEIAANMAIDAATHGALSGISVAVSTLADPSGAQGTALSAGSAACLSFGGALIWGGAMAGGIEGAFLMLVGPAGIIIGGGCASWH